MDSFTDRARAAVKRAGEYAQAGFRECIEPEHLLLAILDEVGSVSSMALIRLKVDRDTMRADLRKAMLPGRSGTPFYGSLVSPATIRVIEAAMRHANGMNVGTECLLFGLAMAPSVARDALNAQGVTADKICDAVAKELSDLSAAAFSKVAAMQSVVVEFVSEGGCDPLNKVPTWIDLNVVRELGYSGVRVRSVK